MLGGLQVVRDGQAVDGPWLRQRTGDLLALLVAERHRLLLADEIAEALALGRTGSVGAVHFHVSALRDRLEPERLRGDVSGAILTRGRAYRLGRGVAVDADRFAATAAAGLALHRAGDVERARALLESAADLYRGPFLGARDRPWAALLERERLRAQAAAVWIALADAAERRGDLADADRRLALLAAQEPLDEDVQRRFVALAARRGLPLLALARHAAWRRAALEAGPGSGRR